MRVRAVKGRLTYLDAGRGLAALVVLEHHVMVFNGPVIARLVGGEGFALGVLEFISSLNFHAVMFFFFISGWSIFLSLARIEDANGRPSWTLYLWHRARRILPLFLLSLVWALLLSASTAEPDSSRSFWNLIGNLLFLQTAKIARGGWFTPFAGNDPLWSLAYEVWYYLGLPAFQTLIFARLADPRRRIDVCLLGAVAVGIAAIGLNWLLPNPFLLFAALWPVWLAGYVYGAGFSSREYSRRAALLIGAVALSLFVFAKLINSGSLMALRDGFLVAAAVVALVATFGYFSWVRALLAARPVRGPADLLAYVGLGSYTIYILHYPLVRLAARADNGQGIVYGSIAVLILVGAAPLFETWLQARVNRLAFFGRRRLEKQGEG